MGLIIKKVERSKGATRQSAGRITFKSSSGDKNPVVELLQTVEDIQSNALKGGTRMPVLYLDLLYDLQEGLRQHSSSVVTNDDALQYSLGSFVKRGQQVLQLLEGMTQEMEQAIKTADAEAEKLILAFQKQALALIEKLNSKSMDVGRFFKLAEEEGLAYQTNALRKSLAELSVEQFCQRGWDLHPDKTNYRFLKEVSSNWSARDYTIISNAFGMMQSPNMAMERSGAYMRGARGRAVEPFRTYMTSSGLGPKLLDYAGTTEAVYSDDAVQTVVAALTEAIRADYRKDYNGYMRKVQRSFAEQEQEAGRLYAQLQDACARIK